MNSEIKVLLANLISYPSITPQDEGCQSYMIQFFNKLGFDCQCFDNFPVANFFARKGSAAPLIVFAGHSDVVPVGDENNWLTPPFYLTEKDGLLYGRGTADMKGSLAAMMHMAEKFLQDYPNFSGSLGFLITSGEEGDFFDLGTPYLMAELYKQGLKIDYCIVGEPSSTEKIGDTLKIGRRGSLTAKVLLQGKQGHVAYPHLAQNPIHLITPALSELTNILWDNGNEHFPPTSLQITQIQAGGQANNIIPGELTLDFNFRFSTEHSPESLQKLTLECFQRHQLSPTIHWKINGLPFLTAQGKLLDSCIATIEKICGQRPVLSTSGGTSDGRFIAPYDVEVIELGPINKTIHQINEHVSLEDLNCLSTIYYELCKNLICG